MIGILDSGSGGLTVMKALREALPSSDITYFADIKNAPYGSKSQRELSALTVAAIKRLQQEKVTRIISACNSVSASLAVSLLDATALKQEFVIEMVGPTVSYFKCLDTRIALCATQATVDSGMYENAFSMIGKDVISIPIPELAGAIEFGKPREDLEIMVRDALQNQLGKFDVLILACTHYPLVADIFNKICGPEVIIFDPAYAVSKRAEKLFWPQEVGYGSTRFLVSGASPQFKRYVEELFPGLDYSVEVVE